MSNLKSMYTTVQKDAFPETLTVTLGEQTLTYQRRAWTIDGESKGLRYGENPDQPAALYQLMEGTLTCGGITFRGPEHGLVSAMHEKHMLQAGKHPGKTNLTDVDNGANILQYLAERPAAVILKHNNPCGCAWSRTDIADAFEKAFWGDRIAAFGGAVVLNRALSVPAAERIAAHYFEVVAAPAFDTGTLDILTARKNLRILHLPGLAHVQDLTASSFLDIKSLCDGGLIVQKSFVNKVQAACDFMPACATHNGLTVTARKPTPHELDDLYFAWAVEAGVTSNSVIFARDGATVAIGTGEQDRVGCVAVAIHKAYTKYADMLAFRESGLSLYELTHKAGAGDTDAVALLNSIKTRTQEARGGLTGTVLVSDGFFPFRDGVDVAIAEGVRAVAQPGGSLRDHEVIMACNEATPQVAMVYTGQRSFKH